MASLDPSTGPVPREVFATLIAAPYGEAIKAIRKYDPLWGLEPGKKIEWKIRVRRRVDTEGTAYVKAASEKEAEKLVEDLSGGEVDWDYDDEDDFDIVSIKPEPSK